MPQILYLLVPAFDRSVKEPAGKLRRVSSSALVHLTTALAVAIIASVGAALATYFLTQGVILWTAVAGGGALISGPFIYVVLRCALGRRPKRNEQQPSVEIEKSSDVEESSETLSAEGTRRNKGKADIKGTVYIHSSTSGPIRRDRYFNFAERLQTEEGEPFVIEEEDIYLEVEGKFKSLKANTLYQDANGLPMTRIYLPASLFEGVNEGETVRFIYDGRLVELTCKQAKHPHPEYNKLPFQDFLEYVRRYTRFNQTQALWNEDLEGEPQFMGQPIGQTLVPLNGNSDDEEFDLQFYEEDQKAHGPYQQLEVVNYNGDTVVFRIHRDFGIDISEIALVESKGINGLHQLWILIPHKPKKNKFPKGTNQVISNVGNRTETLYKESFDPQNGDRMTFYRYGQYFKLPVSNSLEDCEIELNYDESGWLTLHFEKIVEETD